MARPTKLNPDMIQRICRVIHAGNYIETAAAYAGISKSSLYDWMKRGREERDRIGSGMPPVEGEAIYLEFLDSIEKALAAGEIRDVAIIAKAAEDTWQASAWRLERRFPFRWGRREHHHIDEGGETEHKSLLDVLLAAQKKKEAEEGEPDSTG